METAVMEEAKSFTKIQNSIEADEVILDAWIEYSEINAKIKELSKHADMLKDKIKDAMKDAEILTFGGEKIAANKTEVRQTIDTKALKEEDPDVYNKYLKQTVYSRFTINNK